MKFLIGITPTGLITFTSNVYGGCTSDRYIFEKEFLDKVEPGDTIMVDRGFNIADLLLEKKAKLYIPPFTRKKAGSDCRSLTQSEIAKTREVASLRIHVERSIERMEKLQIAVTDNRHFIMAITRSTYGHRCSTVQHGASFAE